MFKIGPVAQIRELLKLDGPRFLWVGELSNGKRIQIWVDEEKNYTSPYKFFRLLSSVEGEKKCKTEARWASFEVCVTKCQRLQIALAHDGYTQVFESSDLKRLWEKHGAKDV